MRPPLNPLLPSLRPVYNWVVDRLVQSSLAEVSCIRVHSWSELNVITPSAVTQLGEGSRQSPRAPNGHQPGTDRVLMIKSVTTGRRGKSAGPARVLALAAGRGADLEAKAAAARRGRGGAR